MITEELTNEITEMLLSFKVQPEIMGFEYLRTGIKLCFEDDSLKNNITKKLYPKVAEIFNSSPETVERAMRTAVENCYNCGGLLEVNEQCGLVVYKNDFKWTNGEMITTLVELIKLKETRKAIENKLKELEEAN
ncbi:MAG: sporulation initiation factor Spo0A C-terminal domain-containing protein [Clostridia bacterium]|nr:sporulation initiation factor Spo0A C-terminal domain-containing protein [Clostridia bacterium]